MVGLLQIPVLCTLLLGSWGQGVSISIIVQATIHFCHLTTLVSQPPPPHIDLSIISMEKNSGFIIKAHLLPFSQWPLFVFFVFSGEILSSPLVCTSASVNRLWAVDAEICTPYSSLLSASSPPLRFFFLTKILWSFSFSLNLFAVHSWLQPGFQAILSLLLLLNTKSVLTLLIY